MTEVSNYRNTLVELVKDSLASPNAKFYKWGIWMPACAMHTWTASNTLYTS